MKLNALNKGMMPEGLTGEAMRICIDRLEMLGTEMLRRKNETKQILSTVGVEANNKVAKAAAHAVVRYFTHVYP